MHAELCQIFYYKIKKKYSPEDLDKEHAGKRCKQPVVGLHVHFDSL